MVVPAKSELCAKTTCTLMAPKASHTSGRMPSTNTSTTSNKNDVAWINEVRNNVNLAQPMDHPKRPCTIFKVPKNIRRLDPEAYKPVIAFLGPFHHNRCKSSFMKYHKWRCVRHLLSRHGSPEHASHLLDKCLLKLKEQDDNVRSCYSEEFYDSLGAHRLALMMLLDGCFIIYLMLKMYARKKGMEEETREEEEDEDELLNEEIEGEEREEESEGRLEGEASEEDEGHKREGEVILNIEEKDKKLGGPTVAGLFTLDLVVYDLLKLENQIPFFIIQFLFEQLKPCEDEKIDLVDLALQLFEGIHPKESKSFKEKKKESPRKYHHLLHLFYLSRVPSKNPAESTSQGEAAPSQGASTSAPTSTSAPGCNPGIIEHMKSKWKKAETDPSQGTPTSAPKWIPSAMELDRTGVKFKRKESADSFLNLTFAQRKMKLMPLLCLSKLRFMFKSGQMEIPPLQIYDYTLPLFRNLIAFEQCYVHTEMYITIYALFMDCIINQAEDARLLNLEGILEHKLSNDQAVAEHFYQLGNQIHFVHKKNYLANQIEEVNKFYGSKWHKWLARWKRDYFSNPWTTISVLAAIFLLLLTIEQAVFAALSYFYSS